MPERRRLIRHGQDAIARGVLAADARLEQEPRHEERHARGERREKVGEHDKFEDRRPIECEESTDAARRKHREAGETEAEADPCRPKGVRHGVERRVLGPKASGVRRAPKGPLSP